jgi:hypothetical protein
MVVEKRKKNIKNTLDRRLQHAKKQAKLLRALSDSLSLWRDIDFHNPALFSSLDYY